MKPKNYTAKQASALIGSTFDALHQQLYRDSKKPKSKRKYPHAFKTECCGAWVIPERDLKLNEDK
jgi:hypothetical protein